MIILARSLLFSFTVAQRALFDSKYHAHGPLQPAISRPAELLFSERGRQLNSILQNLQSMRKVYLQSKPKGSEGYLQTYLKFCKQIEDGFSPNPSIYRLIGWYNVQSLHKKLLERLIAIKEQPQPLIESLAWMNLPPKGDYGFIDKDLREKGKIEGLFRNLKPTLSIQHLQQLNSIILSPLTLSKRIFMENYALMNLPSMLDEGTVRGTDIIWLLQAITSSMIDREDLTSKFQAFLKTLTSASQADCQSLMKTYSLRGRIDKSIYQSLIRPYLNKYKMKDAQSIIQAIKFTVLSESQDYHLLKNLFELLGKENHINNKQLYDLHIITHYLRVKGLLFQLGAKLQKKLVDFCRLRSESKATINHLILDMDSTKKRKKNSEYISKCLVVEKHRLTELQATKRSVFEDAFRPRLSNLAINNMSLYEKSSFCCFELDFCLHDPSSQQFIDLEIQGLQYVFSSDRLARWQQIRQETLQYYGIKVNRLKYYEFLEKPYLNCADLPPKKGKFFSKK